MKTGYKFLAILMVLGLALVAMPAGKVQANGGTSAVVYDAVPATLGPSYPSLGFQATSTSEFGDFIHLAGSDRALRTVTVTMVTWAYQATYPALTDPTGWDHPITLNIYNAVAGTPKTVGSLLATKTQTFHIPWRPVADPTCSPPTAWRAGDGNCYNGYAFNITFNMGSLNITLPDDIIVGVAYNTNTWGYNPIGLPGPYESLNVGAIAGPATIGTDDNADRVFWSTLYPGYHGTFIEDTGWTPNGTLPIQITADTQTVVPVYVLDPSWTAPGGGGVYSAYYGPLYYTPVSPGSTALFDGREAGIIKAGIIPDTDNNYYDEGLLGFQVPNVPIADFAVQALMYDVQNESGTNPVWVRIRLVGGTTYQFVPTTNPAGWHTVDAAAGEWQLMDNNGNATGPMMSLSTLAASIPSAVVDRVYLTLGMGNSYNVSPGVGTVGWVDKVTIGSTTYDFLVEPTCTTDCYVSTTGSDSNKGNEFSPFRTIQKGIDTVSVGGNVHVAAGTYSESKGGWRDIEIFKSVSLLGTGSGSTIVEFTGLQHGIEVRPDTIGNITIQGFTFTKHGTNTLSAEWGILVGETGGTFNSFTLKDVALGYSSARNLHFAAAGTYNNVSILDSNIHDSGVYGASFQGTTVGLTIDNSHFDYNGKDDTNHAYGLAFEGNVSIISVTNSTFDHNYAQGINATRISNAVFDGISCSYNNDGNAAPRDIESGFNLWDFTGGSHYIILRNSVFSHNGRSGIVLGDEGYDLTNIQISSNTIDGNIVFGIIPWTTTGHLHNLTIHHNRIINSPWGIAGNPDVVVNAENNWFGCNAGPSDGACSPVGAWGSGTFDTNPWLVLKTSAAPALAPGVTSAFTADFTFNSADVDTSSLGYLPASTTVGFTPTDYMDPDSSTLTSGKAVSTFTPPVGAATFDVCAVLDSQTTCLPYTNPAPKTVYVDIDWIGKAAGAAVTPAYPAGAPAAIFGFNAFDNLQDALAAVAAGTSSTPSYVYVDAGTYDKKSGAALIDKNWVYLLLNTGAVVKNSSPCFTVAADYVTIKSETLAGAKCVPTGGADGVVVSGARTNLTLEKFEIDGAAGANGVHFTGVMTDVVITDLYVHGLGANGILFDAAPVRVVDIHGNMFRDNFGNGIEAGAFIVPAEYNSWGSYDGPTAGDGISSGVDAIPWTHVDLSLVSSGTPIVKTVVTGNTITYAVRAYMKNVTSMDFTLNYPSNLTFVSSAKPGNFSVETLTQTTGKLHFVAYQYGTGISGSNYLFEATFTAGAPGTDLPMDLDAAIDGFGMATAGSSTNIYAYALTDSTVTIKDALDLTALSLIESVDLSTWTPVFGVLPAYTMGIDPANAYEYLGVSSLTVNHPLADGLHPYYLNPAGLPASFYTYWAGKGVVSGATGWQGVMWDIIHGTQPMFYLKVTGTSYDLVDGLQKLIGAGDQPLRISGDYPLGTYNFSGTVTDIYGGTDTVPVSITFIEPLVLQSLDLLDSLDKSTWTDVYGTLTGGFTKVIDPLNEYEYLDAANLVANRTLADGLYPYYLDTAALPTGFYEYWAAKGVTSAATPGTWEAKMWEIINGTQPMFYLKVSGGGTVFDLIDGLQYLMGGGEQTLRLNGTYPLGTYNFKGTVEDEFGVVGNVAVALTLIPPLDLSAADLLESVAPPAWTTVYGTLPAGYVMAVDPANAFEYLDAANVVVNRTLADDLYPLYLDTTSVPTGYYAYWAAQGVVSGATGWQGVMWSIISGAQPIAYLKVDGSSYDLIDGFQYLMGAGEQPLRVSGDSPLGTYTFKGTVADLFGYTDSVTMKLTLVGTWWVKGTFSMQGRAYRGDVPVTLTGTIAPIFGPYTGSTINTMFQNLTITGVQGGTYMITTLQPRYLNVIAANNKVTPVTANRVLSPLEMKGGNAIWRIADGLGGWIYNNKVDVADASAVGSLYGTGTIVDDADVNFDNKVNIQDLALVGGNFYLTSAEAYGIGPSLVWIP